MFRVDRVKFLVHALQLFVGALQLFVGRHELFVGGLQFFVCRFQLFDCGLQTLSGVLELLLGLDYAIGYSPVLELRIQLGTVVRFEVRWDEDHCVALRPVGTFDTERPDDDVQFDQLVVAHDADASVVHVGRL